MAAVVEVEQEVELRGLCVGAVVCPVDASSGYCMLMGVFKGRGSLSSFRWGGSAGPHGLASRRSALKAADTPLTAVMRVPWPPRWLEGDPRDKFDPVILGSGDSVFTDIAHVAVNWVRANMQPLTERYGPPKVSASRVGQRGAGPVVNGRPLPLSA